MYCLRIFIAAPIRFTLRLILVQEEKKSKKRSHDTVETVCTGTRVTTLKGPLKSGRFIRHVMTDKYFILFFVFFVFYLFIFFCLHVLIYGSRTTHDVGRVNRFVV